MIGEHLDSMRGWTRQDLLSCAQQAATGKS
jgi:hypothetical protein